jgi:hypothetical protein
MFIGEGILKFFDFTFLGMNMPCGGSLIVVVLAWVCLHPGMSGKIRGKSAWCRIPEKSKRCFSDSEWMYPWLTRRSFYGQKRTFYTSINPPYVNWHSIAVKCFCQVVLWCPPLAEVSRSDGGGNCRDWSRRRTVSRRPCHCESRFIGMWQSKNITFLQFHQIF